ncbi:hypothetical protein ACFSTE_09500 [Aquimarina hainanensis]|uniref:Uncharacterized protein n=1 Tax=Aquimarina hainanensis TaxID=1578017 RepID=A0ABW5N607_9FLAO
MGIPKINIDGREVVIVDHDLFKDMLFEKAAIDRENKRKGHSSLYEALKIMGCGKTKFYQIQKDPKCKIRKAGVNGSYLTSSLYDELKRREALWISGK